MGFQDRWITNFSISNFGIENLILGLQSLTKTLGLPQI